MQSKRNKNEGKRGELSIGIYSKLKEMICSGALKPNKTLNLHRLTEIFNTSVTPINSALSMLAEEGLVIKRPNKSAIVAAMSVEEVKDVWLRGALLEGMAAYLAVSNITDDQILVMEQITKNMEELNIPSEIAQLKELNQKFHGIFLRACKNRELLDLLRESSMMLYRYYILAASLQGAVTDFVVQHRSIIDNLRRRDPRGTREAVEQHIITEGEKVIICLGLGMA